MPREIMRNLFSTTLSRGRLEYVGVVAGLVAAAFLSLTFGFAAYPIKIVAFPLFFAALVPLAALLFVAAQRVRDMGWNAPLFLAALLLAEGLSCYGGLTQNGAFLVASGPWAIVSAVLLTLLAFVPGKSFPQSKPVAATA